jgi:hypothetical protein
MTINIVTSLIAGALLAGSAAASLQATDASLASTPISERCHSRTESTTSGESTAVVLVPAVRPFSASAGAFRQRAPHIIFLKPLTPGIQHHEQAL